jgi:hypothetical protein
MKKLLFILLFSFQINAFAQLANGSVAPDFTLTDYYGTSHNLYSYLNSGKTVFVEIFAAHCPSCWSYHLTHTMKNMYNIYGPNGTNEVMVLALEHDQWNDSNAFIGNGPAWVTQGNWLTGTPFPIFDVEDPYRGVFTDYDVSFYPVVYKICPNKIIERIYTSETVTQLYQKVQNCLALSIEEQNDLEKIYINQYTKSLIIEPFQKVRAIKILNLQGQVVKYFGGQSSANIGLGELKTGLYLFEINTPSGTVFKKIYLN